MLDKIWLIEFLVPADVTEAFMESIGEYADSMSCFEYEGDKIWKVQLYIQSSPDEDGIRGELKRLSNQEKIDIPELNILQIDNIDWVSNSQKNFESVYAGDFFIFSSYTKQEVPSDKISIEIDPQQAFGTGGHETTRGCLIAMQNLSKNNVNDILDMGCGSGVLAIAAAKYWKDANLLAVDNDSGCVDTSIFNAKLNNVDNRINIALSDGYGSTIVNDSGPYDLIISNILATPLIEFAPLAKKVLNKNGYIILAGLMTEHSLNVIDAYNQQGLKLVSNDTYQDWSVITMKL